MQILRWNTFCSFLLLCIQFLCSVLHRSKSCAGHRRGTAVGSDVLVGQVLDVVLGELCALHCSQVLKQLSHEVTLFLLQQHQCNLEQTRRWPVS